MSGWTHLRGGRRVPKDHGQLRFWGELDELNCFLGAAAAQLKVSRILGPLRRAQAALLAGDGSCAARVAQELEQSRRSLSQDMPSLHDFVIPGGSAAGASLHVARAVCRRAERAAVAWQRRGRVPAEVLTLLNVLSGWLFVAARWVNENKR